MNRTIAVIGASSNPEKFSYHAVAAYLELGYKVYPIHPRLKEVLGQPVLSHISEVPDGPLDMVSLYVPPEVGLDLLEAIAAKGCHELWLNPGSESPELIQRAQQLGLNVVQACSLVAARHQARDRGNARPTA